MSKNSNYILRAVQIKFIIFPALIKKNTYVFKSIKQTKMLLLSVKAKMLCLKANLIRAKALLPKANLL